MNGIEKKMNGKTARNKQIIGGKTMKILMRLITMTALLFVAVNNTLAQVNPVVSMQGFLTDAAGNALPDGEYEILFRIYDDAAAGTKLWEESHNVVLDHGLYDAFLGSSQPLNIQLNRDLWLSVEVNDVLQPRLRIGYSFFSLKSLKSDSSTHALNSDFLGGRPASFYEPVTTFNFESLSGTASDAQIPDDITINSAGNADSLGGAAAQSYALKSELDFVPQPDYAFNLPTVQGGNGMVMTNDGAGNLSWVTPSEGGGEVVDGAFSTTANVTSNIPGNLAVDDFVFGSTQLDDDGIGVHERRMFFDKSKGAFRAGFSNLGNWNDVNIGEFSAAFGRDTKASGNWSTAFGRDTEASGNWSIAMGNNLIADGNNSIAFGSAASTNDKNGAIVFGDASTTTYVTADKDNQFKVRAAGGVTFLTNSQMTTGVSLVSGGGAWLTLSDSTMKRNIKEVNTKQILNKVMELPIKRWNYKSQGEEIEHIGPMAQDFYSIFNVGDNNVTISTIDPSGIALAAIQELYKSTKELKGKTDEISELRMELRELREIINGIVSEIVR